MKRFLVYFLKNHIFLIMVAVFVWLFYKSSSRLPAESVQYPNIIMIGIVALLLWNIVGSVIEFREYIKENPSPEKKSDIVNKSQIKSRFLNFFTGSEGKIPRTKIYLYGLTILYAILLPLIGFIVSSMFYVGGMTFLLGAQKKINVLIFVVCFVGFMYALFVLWLGVPLNKGFLF